MERSASAQWRGGLKDGHGDISTAKGSLDNAGYSFATRFEDGKGTNPEELIGAAHAACFSMALAIMLGEAGYEPEVIDTRATVSLEESGDGFSITAAHLDVTAAVPGADAQAFEKAATAAKAGCPVSRLLNAEITLQAKLA